MLLGNNRRNLDVVAEHRLLPSFRELFQMATAFGIAVLAWIVFRAESITHAFSYLGKIFSRSLFEMPYIVEAKSGLHLFPAKILLLIAVFMFIECDTNNVLIYEVPQVVRTEI